MKLLVKRLCPGAVIPKRSHDTDSGFDVTPTRIIDEMGDILFLGTGISIVPESGYYTKLVARSSLCKKGWMLANSIGIIDEGYRGEIIIALVPIGDRRQAVSLLNIPIAQLVVCKREDVEIIETEDEHSTNRGIGGFGSTG